MAYDKRSGSAAAVMTDRPLYGNRSGRAPAAVRDFVIEVKA